MSNPEERISETITKDPAKAQVEAQVLQNEIAPKVKNAVKATAEKMADDGETGLKDQIKPLSDTGYLELGSQRLKQIQKESPDYYYALIDRQEAINELTDSLRPGYIGEIWKKGHRVSEGNARRQAETVSDESKINAEESAREKAYATVNAITSEVLRDRKDFEMPMQTMDRVNEAIKQKYKYGIYDEAHIEPRQIGAINKGVWATLNMVDEERKQGGNFGVDMNKALNKQAKFDAGIAESSQSNTASNKKSQ